MKSYDEDASKPVPPALTWEELEFGLGGQLPLPGVTERPTTAERIYLSVARAWARQFSELPVNGPPPRRLDEMALGALSIACSCGSRFTTVARQQIQVNVELAKHRAHSSWLDQLPWSLAQITIETNPSDSWPVNQLVANLNHHNSAIRIWMMEIAWTVRVWLPRDKAVPLLLENVAATLVGVEIAWGLAAALFEHGATFHETAMAWSPGNNFSQQYAERTQILKDQTFACQASFWKLEADIYRRLFRYTFEGSDLSSAIPATQPVQ